MCGFSESADICIILDKNGNILADFEKFQEMCEKLEISNILLDHKNALVFCQAVSGKFSWSFTYK